MACFDQDYVESAWSSLDPKSGPIISQFRVELACMLEAEGKPPPVMFANYSGLCGWATAHCLSPTAIHPIRKSSAVRIAGQYRGSGQSSFWYDQIWVRRSYTRYARSLAQVTLTNYRIEKASLSGVHADHIINRARLRLHPDAWVAIFPVDRSANCPFGIIEKKLPDIDIDVVSIDLPPLVALKLYCGVLPRTRRELDLAMRDIRGQLFASQNARSYCDQIALEAMEFIPFERLQCSTRV